jgi:molybdate transport system substrate-binding protein
MRRPTASIAWRGWWACLLLSTGLPLLAPAAAAGQARPEVVVSAAVSLGDVLARLVPIVERQAGVRLVVNLGASNILARQIVAGARVDLFISADEAQMDVVAGQVVSGTRRPLVRNQLAVAVARDSARTVRAAGDLRDTSIRRIAIGDPYSVPAGVYARQWLEHVGLWSALQTRLLPTASVRAALATVERGAADAAIVYRTDLATAPRARLAMVIAPPEGPVVVYPAAVIRDGRNAAGARRVLDALFTSEARAVFTGAGFLQP